MYCVVGVNISCELCRPLKSGLRGDRFRAPHELSMQHFRLIQLQMAKDVIGDYICLGFHRYGLDARGGILSQ